MSEERKEKARVGIIGAGIAGSFTAFFFERGIWRSGGPDHF